MKFLCGSCRTKYQISDEKVRGKILTIRCKKCSAKILVREALGREPGVSTAVAPIAEEEERHVERSRVASAGARSGGSASLASAYDSGMHQPNGETDDMPTSIAPVPANLDIAGVEWYVAIDGAQHGPFAFAEVVRKVTSQEVIGRHYVWHDGMANWSRVRDVADLSSYLEKKKRAPPPPPPPSLDSTRPRGAEVVNFEEKRAERQRRDALATGSIPDVEADLEATEVATPEHGLIGSEITASGQTNTDRAEQLDSVLNEALGIEGEGRTTRAEADSAAISTPMAGVVEPVSAKISSNTFDALKIDGEDDIFAAIPRASDDAEAPRESTRFFVAAAGVNKQKSRKKVGLLVGVVAALMFGLFIAGWALGYIPISIPGIGNPFERKTDTRQEIAQLDEDLQDEDIEAMADSLSGAAKQKRLAELKRRRQRARARRRAQQKAAAAGEGFIVDEDEGAGTRGPRGANSDSPKLEIDLKTGGFKKSTHVGDVALPEADVKNIPLVQQSQLTSKAINSVIAGNKTAVSQCYQNALRGEQNLGGKIEFGVRVRSSGRVASARVRSPEFRGTQLATCIADRIKGWVFPPFDGETQEIVVPFLLQKRG